MTQEIWDKFKMGYFILYKNSGGLFGDAIVRKQLASGFNKEDAQYTHVEVSGGENHSVDIAPPTSKLVNIEEAHKGEYAKLVRYKDKNYEDRLRYKVAYFSATLCNRGYDFQGILSFLFRWVHQNNRMYFCSEGAAWALTKVFPGVMGKEPDKCMPADFFNSYLFEIMWEGKIE